LFKAKIKYHITKRFAYGLTNNKSMSSQQRLSSERFSTESKFYIKKSPKSFNNQSLNGTVAAWLLKIVPQ